MYSDSIDVYPFITSKENIQGYFDKPFKNLTRYFYALCIKKFIAKFYIVSIAKSFE